MNYNDALLYIHSTPKFSRILGNDLLKKLLDALGNPQKELSFIHIAGTNGKGSTAAMTASVLKEAGYKTGLFTSPFIEKFNERIQINSEPISDSDLSELTLKVKKAIEDNDAPVSEFALITAIAFLYFKKENCDIVILETGMGGRLDATNIITNPLVCAITSISLDHTQYLGDTIEKIASEKCGIIKEDVPLILYPIQEPEVFDTARKFCKDKNSELIIPDIPAAKNNGFSYKGELYSLSLKGSYQIYNASVCIEILNILKKSGYRISNTHVKAGLNSTKWIARFEFLTPDLVIDGSHNPDGVLQLKKDLLKQNRSITLVVAMMEDKECEECVRIMSEITNDVIVTALNMPRCKNPHDLAHEFLKHKITPEIRENAKDATKLALSKKNLVCVCGSLYLAGEIRKIFKTR